MRRIGNGLAPRSLLIIFTLLGLVGARPALADSEAWDAIYVGGNKVGHMRIRVIPVQDGERKLTRVLVDFELNFKRGRDSSHMEVQYGTIETPEGQVLRLDTKTLASQQVLRVHGDVINDKMKLMIENGDQKQEKVIDWTPDTRGPYGAEMSLSRDPIKPGESRKLRIYVPEMNKIGDSTLTAKGLEMVALGGGMNKELLKVDQEIAFDNGKKAPEMNSTLWVDTNGQILKTFTDSSGGMVTYRTTKEAALKIAPQFDQMAASIIKIGRKIKNPEDRRSVIYKLTMPDVNPVEIFPNDRRQTVKAADPNSATLEVKTAGPDDGEAGPQYVGPEFLRSNPLITCDDQRVVAFARRAVGKTTDPWAKVQAINKWVAKNLTNKNFETSFAPADEVARTLAGDCTEHAVLAAAMCRAQDVPARVATGLVYVDHLGGFGFHMWNEVYVNRRWVAIDSAFDESQVDAVHLKLSDSSLDGVAPFETFLPVSRVFGKLKIEVIEVR